MKTFITIYCICWLAFFVWMELITRDVEIPYVARLFTIFLLGAIWPVSAVLIFVVIPLVIAYDDLQEEKEDQND